MLRKAFFLAVLLSCARVTCMNSHYEAVHFKQFLTIQPIIRFESPILTAEKQDNYSPFLLQILYMQQIQRLPKFINAQLMFKL